MSDSKSKPSGSGVIPPPPDRPASNLQPTNESVSAIIAEWGQYHDVGIAAIVVNGKCADLLTLMIASKLCKTNVEDKIEKCIEQFFDNRNFKDTVMNSKEHYDTAQGKTVQTLLGDKGDKHSTDMKTITLAPADKKKKIRWDMVKFYKMDILNIKLVNFRRISDIEKEDNPEKKKDLLSTCIAEQFPEVIPESIYLENGLVGYRVESTNHFLSVETFTKILRVREIQKIMRYADVRLQKLIKYAEEINAFEQPTDTTSCVYARLNMLNNARNDLCHTDPEVDCPQYGFPTLDGVTKEKFTETYVSVFEVAKQSIEEYFPALQTKDLDFVKMEMIPRVSIDQVHTVVAEYSRIVSELKDSGYTMEKMSALVNEYKDVSRKLAESGNVANTTAELRRCAMCQPCSTCSKKVESAAGQPPQTMGEDSDLPSDATGDPL